jgi:ATP-dependent Clp protease ATP-binding subunit ClpA
VIVNKTVDDKFNEVNEKLGGAIKLLSTDDKVIGRNKELLDLGIIIERRETNVPLIIGGAGTGKTALVCTYMNMLEESGESVFPIEVDIGAMAEDMDILKVRLSRMMEYIKEFKDVLLEHKPNAKLYLFVDEVHKIVSIFPRGSKIGGDLLKTSLSRAEQFCTFIGATTTKEYMKYIATDDAFDRRFQPLTMEEVDDETTKVILKNWLKKYSKTNPKLKFVQDDVLETIIEYNKQYRTKYHEPAKSLDALISIESASRVLNKSIDIELVKYIFERQYGLDLTFDIDLDYCEKIIKEQIKGQPIAVDTVMNMLLEIKVNAAKKEMEPRYVGMFVGPTGVGKTQMAKAVSEGAFKSKKKFIKMDLTNYSSEDSGDRFRRDLGVQIQDKASSVVLFDEMEKAHDSVLNILLPVLDEGVLQFEMPGAEADMDTQEANLRNTIIFLTSNAGAEVFKTLDKRAETIFEGDVMTDEYQIAQREVSQVVQDALEKSEMRPEFLQRVKSTCPFLGLSQETMILIAQNEIERTLNEYEELTGVNVICPDAVSPKLAGINTEKTYNPLALYIVLERMEKNNTNVNGARHIKRTIQSDIRGVLNKAKRQQPECKKFKFTTNGECRWEITDSAEKRGLLRVEALDVKNRISISS